MKSIPTLTTKNEIRLVFNQLLASHDKKIIDWTKNKAQLWVLSALSQPFSKMEDWAFESVQRTTNVNESVHNQTQKTGIRLSLLGAIQR